MRLLVLAHPCFASLPSLCSYVLRLDVTNNQKEKKQSNNDDAARQDSDDRERKRQERVQEALRRWSVGPKKRGRFQR